MIRVVFTLWVCSLLAFSTLAQGSFAPQAGEPGSLAIPKDSSIFRDWGRSCSVDRGLRQIDIPDSGYATTGALVYATGPADAPLTLSLGDGGVATLQFAADIYDGPGADFAVFENGFGTGPEAFLELAFVEVSSDGQHFFRFPSVSEITSDVQKGTFENTDATYIYNLAGKYTANYGTPFDLSELNDTNLLDKLHITHVRIIDVIGAIDSNLASQDSHGNVINDPWPTNFPQSGFDLDAIGVIHSRIPLGIEDLHPSASVSDAGSYDLNGRLLPEKSRNTNHYQPGVVIRNGKKVVVMP